MFAIKVVNKTAASAAQCKISQVHFASHLLTYKTAPPSCASTNKNFM